MKNPTVWRVHLKTDKNDKISYRDLLEYCKEHQIIGIGWPKVTGRNIDADAIKAECNQAYPNDNGAYKAIHAISQVQEGDLIWTRVGEDASEYYLCRVGSKIWTDMFVPEEDQRTYDLANIVSAKWVRVGKQRHVPGKVVCSFFASAAMQRVTNVQHISMSIWNELSRADGPKYPYTKLTTEDFWRLIGHEELESLVLLYLQTRGYYIYPSKKSNPKYETVLVSRDGQHYAYPQVKEGVQLIPEVFAEGVDPDDKVFLFTSSEDYGNSRLDNVECITKAQLEEFMESNKDIQTVTVKGLLSRVKNLS